MSALACIAGIVPLHIAVALSRLPKRVQRTLRLVARCSWSECRLVTMELRADARTYRRHLAPLGFYRPSTWSIYPDRSERRGVVRVAGGVYACRWTACECVPF